MINIYANICIHKMEKVKVKKSLELDDIMDIEQEKPGGGAGGV